MASSANTKNTSKEKAFLKKIGGGERTGLRRGGEVDANRGAKCGTLGSPGAQGGWQSFEPWASSVRSNTRNLC